MRMKENKAVFEFYTVDEFSDIWSNEDRLVFIDTESDELVAKYEDIPDIIVDINKKLGSTDISIIDFNTGDKLLNTIGIFLDKCKTEVREDIINRLVKLQLFDIEPKKYKLLTEDILEEFYEICDAFSEDFDDPYTDEELNLMEEEYLSRNISNDDYDFEERDFDED